MTNDDVLHPLTTAVRICSTLGLDPNLIRASLEAERLGPMLPA